MLGLFLSKFSFVFCLGQQWWYYLKIQLLVSIKCRLGTQCRLRSKLFEYLIWICGFRVIILPDPKVTYCRSPDLFCKKFLLGLFTLKKILLPLRIFICSLIWSINMFMICFIVKGIQIKAFQQLPIVIKYKYITTCFAHTCSNLLP